MNSNYFQLKVNQAKKWLLISTINFHILNIIFNLGGFILFNSMNISRHIIQTNRMNLMVAALMIFLAIISSLALINFLLKLIKVYKNC